MRAPQVKVPAIVVLCCQVGAPMLRPFPLDPSEAIKYNGVCSGLENSQSLNYLVAMTLSAGSLATYRDRTGFYGCIAIAQTTSHVQEELLAVQGVVDCSQSNANTRGHMPTCSVDSPCARQQLQCTKFRQCHKVVTMVRQVARKKHSEIQNRITYHNMQQQHNISQ